MLRNMATLRISTSSYGMSLLALLSHLGCGGEVADGASSSHGGKSGTSNGGTAAGGTSATGFGGGGGGVGGDAISSLGGSAVGGATVQLSCTVISEANGFETCDGGWSHRTVSKDCPNLLPRATSCTVTSVPGSCAVDADCTAQPHGHCEAIIMGGCYCSYGCIRDADCAAGQICRCGTDIGQCTTASCATDTSCPGGYCATYDTTAGCGGVGFACTQPSDVCVGAVQCPGGYCTLDVAGNRMCSPANCVIGRPFLVQGKDRRATQALRSDWLEVREDSALKQLSSEQRRRLGTHYVELALMEHAAVAAFGRLLLELMGHGAPSDLVGLVVSAQADETRHARSMFGLASQLLEGRVGPSPLSMKGVALGSALETLAYGTVVEGCVGETIAALEAAEATERVVSSQLRGLFAGIATDEWMHASLSWRIVAWLLTVGNEKVRAAVEQAFANAQAQAEPPCENLPADEAYGALTSETRKELRRQAWIAVIVPCRNRLLHPGGSGALPISNHSAVA